MSDAATVSLTRHRSFVLFWCARTFSNGAFMMQGVAVGWQLYALTNDPLDLGLVGLVQFFPIVAMSVIAGQLLDMFDRRFVAGACQIGTINAYARPCARASSRINPSETRAT